jgi:hypothetical protein
MLSLSYCFFPSLTLNSKDYNTTIILPFALYHVKLGLPQRGKSRFENRGLGRIYNPKRG